MKGVPAPQRGQHKADGEHEESHFQQRRTHCSAKEPGPAPGYEPVGEEQDRLNDPDKDREPESQMFSNPSTAIRRCHESTESSNDLSPVIKEKRDSSHSMNMQSPYEKNLYFSATACA